MLSIILPTYNEAKNLPELLKRIAGVLEKAEYEVIVVDDDSPDGTWKIAEDVQKEHATLRVIRRIGRKGLSSAVVEGFDAAKGDTLLVMDSDLQHDPSLILQLSDAIKLGAGIAVASRYMEGGSVGEWVRGRRLLSKTATWLTRKIPAVEVSDPMSGFFALSKSSYDAVRLMLHPTGFKILFEILGHLPKGTKAVTVPLVFKMRVHGESKLSIRVQIEFLLQILRMLIVRFQSPVFWVVSLILAFLITLNTLPITLLYTDSSVRSYVQKTLTQVAKDGSWLLSDVTIMRITYERMYLHYQPHRRGPDDVLECYSINYFQQILQAERCDD